MFYSRGGKKGSLAKCWEGHYEMLLRRGEKGKAKHRSCLCQLSQCFIVEHLVLVEMTHPLRIWLTRQASALGVLRTIRQPRLLYSDPPLYPNMAVVIQCHIKSSNLSRKRQLIWSMYSSPIRAKIQSLLSACIMNQKLEIVSLGWTGRDTPAFSAKANG